jgi:tight adherence protein C
MAGHLHFMEDRKLQGINMTTLTLLIFIAVAGMGLLIMQPVLASYTQNYMMRVRVGNVQLDSRKIPARKSPAIIFCRSIGRFVLAIYPGLATAGIKKTLIEANLRNDDHVAVFIGVKVLCTVLPCLFLAVQGSWLYAAMSVFIGWILPNYSILGRANKRKQAIFLELSTVIDLIGVCSRAGLGLLAAIDKVAKNLVDTCPVIKEELDQTLADIKVFARPLTVALQDLSKRCGVEELDNLISALVISDQKGSDISSTLQKQSLALRDRIKRRAEEQLNQAPVKMVPIIIFFIFPLLMVPSIGPSIMHLIELFGKIVGGGK